MPSRAGCFSRSAISCSARSEFRLWGVRLLLGLLLLGFPLALIFAWVYELTPEGLKRERDVARDTSVTAHTARKLDVIVIVLLVCAVGLVAADRFFGHVRHDEHSVGRRRRQR